MWRYALGLLIPAAAWADACPADPNKTEPGLCGCGVADSDWDNDTFADSCIDPGATVDASVTVGYKARVDAGTTIAMNAILGAQSVVGAGSSVGVGTAVGPKASIGAGSSIGDSGAVGRRAQIGDAVGLGNSVIISRAVVIGNGTTGGNSLTFGYASSVGINVQFQANGVRLANLVSLGAGCIVAEDTKIGRDSHLGGDCRIGTAPAVGANVVIGPGVNAGTDFTVDKGARIRRGGTFVNTVSVGENSLVGRGVIAGSNITVGADARVGAGATLEDGAVVADDEVVGRGQTVESAVQASCLGIRDSSANVGSAVYSINPSGVPGQEFDVYCEMDPTLDGGGWTLISNRRDSVGEACATTVGVFFANGCSAVTAIGEADSYALNTAQRTAIPRTEMLVAQFLSGVRDDDDMYIVDVTSQAGDLFPNTGTVLQNIPVNGVCTVDRSSCDTSDVWWKYIGHSWFANGECVAGSANNGSYGGNYGVCHNGVGALPQYAASSFAGNRAEYGETKLWGWPGGGAAHQERIFYR